MQRVARTELTRLVAPLNGDSKLSRTGEFTTIPGEPELPPGSELGFFEWPDEEGSLAVAVVPGEDGRIVARWPDPQAE